MTERPRLHELGPTTRFDGRARAYAQYRPSYPAGAIDALLEGLGAPSSLRGADIGAGTGISSRLLAARGVRVDAVEPNAEMRAGADLGDVADLVTWHATTGEETGLRGGAYDLVVCAQSFHWFEPGAALAEFHRLLRTGGRLALVWNDRDTGAGVMGEYEAIIREAAGGDPGIDRRDSHGPLLRSPLFECAPVREFACEQRLDEEGLIGRAVSSSYIPATGARRERMVDAMRGLFAREAVGGTMGLTYRTVVFVGERRDGT